MAVAGVLRYAVIAASTAMMHESIQTNRWQVCIGKDRVLLGADEVDMPGLLRFVVAFSEAPDAGKVGIQMMWDVRAPAIQMSDNLFEALQQVVDGVGLTRTSEGDVHVKMDWHAPSWTCCLAAHCVLVLLLRAIMLI